ncbi:MAG: glycosyltransferase [Undibacterium sp.]|nr:glycosyltransferase [Undibacterium sp.]
MTTSSKTAVFTIVSLNYGAFAKTLMHSLQETHPDWDRHVLFVDRCTDLNAISHPLFTATMIEALPLPRIKEFLFRYGIMELNTAAKPYMFSHLRRLGYENIVYIDPDILVVDRLSDVEALLGQGATGVLTPHLTAPLEDERVPSELDIMRAGAYNLGFLALGSTPQADQFIQWWERKLEHGAVSDPAKGLFTDQKWIDLAPGMFDGFAILRNPGYNVAYWNLPHRCVTQQGGKWFANDQALRFFHFSGFDPVNPKPFSKHQDRLTLETIGDAKILALEYARKVIENGLSSSRKTPYAFGQFSNCVGIPNALRVLYRDDTNVRFQAGENPFEAADYFIHGEAGDLPVILRAVWIEHLHLQRAFPDPLGAHRIAYYHWFADKGAIEINIPEAYVLPIRDALKVALETQQKNIAHPIPIHQLPNYKPSIWARGLVFMHKRVTGGQLGHARLSQYQQISNFGDFLRLGYAQFLGSKWAERIGMGSRGHAKFDPLLLNLPYKTSASNPSVIFPRRQSHSFSGIYIEENQRSLWMSKQARFFVKHAPNNKLKIQLGDFSSLFETAFGQSGLKLSVGFNELPRQTIDITAQTFEAEVDIEHMPKQWPAILHLTPSDSFIPKELGLNEDSRQLSILLKSIHLGDQKIFDVTTISGAAKNNSEDINIVAGINLIGYARSEHGIGQSLRQFATALDASRIDYEVIEFNKNNLSRTQDGTLEDKCVEDGKYGINIFHINADQMEEAALHLPSHLFSRYNIGYWHWELPDMLAEHLTGFNNLNEVWVPTSFVQEAVAKMSPIPVIKIPHAIHFEPSNHAVRSYFDLPESKFLFLVMYDFSSYQERKNPDASIRAFELAFKNASDEVGLVIKTQNSQHHQADFQKLKQRLAKYSNVIWIDRTLTRQEVYDLQAVCDCYVSLHRSEGYGLGPAESMFLGKPVIATNWSGNTEFMHQHNSLPVDYQLVKIERDVGVYKAGNTWAEPSVDHAAKLMHQIVNDTELRNRIGKAAAKTMRDEYSPSTIAKRIQQRLNFIQNDIIGKTNI